MKRRETFICTLTPWLFYFIGSALGHLALGAGAALVFMAQIELSRIYRLKATDWTQFLFFTLILLGSVVPGCAVLRAFQPVIGPALFFLMAFGSLLIGRPFTNQFAREEIPAEFWDDPIFPIHFSRVNRILTFAWGLNFGVALICGWVAVEKMAINPWVLRAIVATSFMATVALTRFLPPWYERNVYKPQVLIKTCS